MNSKSNVERQKMSKNHSFSDEQYRGDKEDPNLLDSTKHMG